MYEAWRVNGGPTLYPSNKTPVTEDVLLIGFIYAFAILGFSFLVVVIGFRGKRICLNSIIIFSELLVLTSIILCNFGQEWEVARVVNATVQYRAGLREEINAEIAVRIGLRSVNITLKTDPPVVQFNQGQINETINYNERFSWNNLGFTQGRAGFGPNAGLVNREFRAAQERGTPYPILWVAEYFTIDGEGIRWGRFYRQAGYYTHILLWLAFPLWVLTVLLFNIALRYGGYFSMLTGITLATANVVYYLVRNPLDLAIPFSAESVLVFSWGWCFWVNAATAIVSFLIGAVVFIIDITCYQRLASWCGVDPLQDTEEVYGDATYHWSPNNSDSPSSVIHVIPVDGQYHTRPIMSAGPRAPHEAQYGPPLRLVRKKTTFQGLQRDNTVILAAQIHGETKASACTRTPNDDAISCSTATSSLSSGYNSPSASSTRSTQHPSNYKAGRRGARVSPTTHC